MVMLVMVMMTMMMMMMMVDGGGDDHGGVDNDRDDDHGGGRGDMAVIIQRLKMLRGLHRACELESGFGGECEDVNARV